MSLKINVLDNLLYNAKTKNIIPLYSNLLYVNYPTCNTKILILIPETKNIIYDRNVDVLSYSNYVDMGYIYLKKLKSENVFPPHILDKLTHNLGDRLHCVLLEGSEYNPIKLDDRCTYLSYNTSLLKWVESNTVSLECFDIKCHLLDIINPNRILVKKVKDSLNRSFYVDLLGIRVVVLKGVGSFKYRGYVSIISSMPIVINPWMDHSGEKIRFLNTSTNPVLHIELFINNDYLLLKNYKREPLLLTSSDYDIDKAIIEYERIISTPKPVPDSFGADFIKNITYMKEVIQTTLSKNHIDMSIYDDYIEELQSPIKRLLFSKILKLKSCVHVPSDIFYPVATVKPSKIISESLTLVAFDGCNTVLLLELLKYFYIITLSLEKGVNNSYINKSWYECVNSTFILKFVDDCNAVLKFNRFGSEAIDDSISKITDTLYHYDFGGDLNEYTSVKGGVYITSRSIDTVRSLLYFYIISFVLDIEYVTIVIPQSSKGVLRSITNNTITCLLSEINTINDDDLEKIL